MSLRYPFLSRPFQSRRGIAFRNRLLAAPIGLWSMAPMHGLSAYAIEEFEAKAAGGAAAVTFGDTHVDEMETIGGERTGGMPLSQEDPPRALFSEFAGAIRRHGAVAGIELSHSLLGSGIAGGSDTSNCSVNTISAETMHTIIEEYRRAVRTIRRAGFQMCTIHCAHGKLIDQWLSPHMNTRSDQHGGSIDNRLRFPVKLIQEIRKEAGARFLIEIRLTGVSPEEDSERFETHAAFINAVSEEIDLCHVSSAGEGLSCFLRTFPCYLQPPSMNVELAAALRRRISVPVVAVGGITSAAEAEKILADGQADFVAMGRALIADPQLFDKAFAGREDDIRPCIGCHSCLMDMHDSFRFSCSVNPQAGRSRVDPHPAVLRRRVVVIGGGPAGMTAAAAAADMGHDVVLLEKTPRLGGILNLFSHDPIKTRLVSYRDYLVNQIRKRDIEIRLSFPATPELVSKENPDAVIAAIGAKPYLPPIPGAEGPNVLTAKEAYAQMQELGKEIAIIGGGMTGCELALALEEGGHHVHILSRTETLHPGLGMPVAFLLDTRLAGVDIRTGCACTAIEPEGVWYAEESGQHFLTADNVILASGMESTMESAGDFSVCAPFFRCAGDCCEPGKLKDAVESAFFAARDIP